MTEQLSVRSEIRWTVQRDQCGPLTLQNSSSEEMQARGGLPAPGTARQEMDPTGQSAAQQIVQRRNAGLRQFGLYHCLFYDPDGRGKWHGH